RVLGTARCRVDRALRSWSPVAADIAEFEWACASSVLEKRVPVERETGLVDQSSRGMQRRVHVRHHEPLRNACRGARIPLRVVHEPVAPEVVAGLAVGGVPGYLIDLLRLEPPNHVEPALSERSAAGDGHVPVAAVALRGLAHPELHVEALKLAIQDEVGHPGERIGAVRRRRSAGDAVDALDQRARYVVGIDPAVSIRLY